MPYEIFLALRHLRAHQRRRLARVTAVIAVVGIAVGVAALILALALASGFRDEMRDKILRGTAHLTVVRSDGRPMLEYQDVASRIIRLDGVDAASGTTYDGALIVGPGASAYAVLRGIDNTSSRATLDIAGSVISGSVQELKQPRRDTRDFPPALLGSELATRTGLKVGDVAEVMAAHSGLSGNEQKRQIHIVGIFRSGLFEYDSTWVYLPLETAAAFSGNAHAAAVVSVQLKNIYDVKSVAADVRQSLGSSYTMVD